MSGTWADLTSDPTSRQILTLLDRLGFEVRDVYREKAYLQLDSEPPMLVVLAVDWDNPRTIVRVTYGRHTMTPERAADWLKGAVDDVRR